ncbi:conjugal transfer protein MobC [Mucilaginibacter myungsuensis]|uniref:Type IV secretory system conjugative DNA transfer family protein n=1 Tax=Mucilaginibacter myungsuensis TaxID=649104 RepID=A0A929KX03_9SPHI|nr:conjugal transfer protein MobC [Mucilaginibacter myungsuensis]MBE9663191.1 type IV secretory system conjugative DNA transfer family protein [Mucilaginibacter myungsuensis]MDN3598826.1 conjugal transfer protein MobC [Mucilaginibacter myungsuensis]
MATGENEQALRRIIDFTRLLSITILIIHFYLSCYVFFAEHGLTHKIVDHVVLPISKLGIFKALWLAKCAALLLLIVSLVGSKGKRDEKIRPGTVLTYCVTGLLFYFLSNYFIPMPMLYMGATAFGYLLFMNGGSLLFRMLKLKLASDIFNRENETFPQEERHLENEYSFNLPAKYRFKGKERDSWINVINPFRGTLVGGSPGAGKSYFVIRHIITQHIRKGFSMLIYDFKYDDLSRIAYNALREHGGRSFYVINFEHIMHRSNPLEPETMLDLTDAMEAARTIMLGLNREWIKKQGDFFVESPINFVTALIWFLKKYEGGRYCTLPHAIELSLVDYKDLFDLLTSEPEIEVLINPFISAWRNEAFEQLEGQIASAKISLARLSSPQLYYVLSGSDFSLDINNPDDPKVVCLANNPQKSQTYGAVLSLYVNRINKLVNRKGQQKCSLIFDEFPTIYFNGIDNLIATARSNKVAVTLAVQDYSQLKKDYGREQAEVIMNIVGNIICGQVTGDTAKQLSERFGKINQQKESISINSSDTSVSRSTQLEYAVPASRIAGLSSGEFVGMVADDPTNKIDLKTFHCEIQNDHDAIRAEEEAYHPIPQIRTAVKADVITNYHRIKADIRFIVDNPQ